MSLERAVFVGICLGFLDRESLHAFDEMFYGDDPRYSSDAWNLSGLFTWEHAAVERYFHDRRSVLLASAGAGRETIALERAGHQVDAFECHPDLVQVGNALLEAQGLQARIVHAPRDECPQLGSGYDGIIIGWSGYMLVQQRDRRVNLLRQLRERVEEGAPVLLSFFHRSDNSRRAKLLAVIGTGVRRLRRLESVEVGDDLVPNFVHYFTEDEIRNELEAGGFKLELFSTEGYGHAVAFAQPV